MEGSKVSIFGQVTTPLLKSAAARRPSPCRLRYYALQRHATVLHDNVDRRHRRQADAFAATLSNRSLDKRLTGCGRPSGMAAVLRSHCLRWLRLQCSSPPPPQRLSAPSASRARIISPSTSQYAVSQKITRGNRQRQNLAPHFLRDSARRSIFRAMRLLST